MQGLMNLFQKGFHLECLIISSWWVICVIHVLAGQNELWTQKAKVTANTPRSSCKRQAWEKLCEVKCEWNKGFCPPLVKVGLHFFQKEAQSSSDSTLPRLSEC